jgi:ATP-dependent Clp protease ATP-binding subunit ClpA
MLELPPDLRARLDRHLLPYARGLIESSARYAAYLHADEVGAEHLLCTLMEDEECAAHRLVEHAFADPETLADEVRALAAGIMVTGSSASLPFSEGGVLALESARRLAAERREASVQVAHLLAAALDGLPEDLRAAAHEAGYDRAGLDALFGPGVATGAARSEGSLFRHFSEDAKRCLSAAARLARGSQGEPIGPAHLILSCLQGRTDLEGGAGLSAARMRVLLRGRMQDPTPLANRALEPDSTYLTFLSELPERAGSLELLARYHAGPTPEIAQVLLRHRVTPALLERAAAAFSDPPS